jgi:hypothetical protein
VIGSPHHWSASHTPAITMMKTEAIVVIDVGYPIFILFQLIPSLYPLVRVVPLLLCELIILFLFSSETREV